MLSVIITVIALGGSLEAQDTSAEKRKARHRMEFFNYSDSLKYFQSYLYASEKGFKTEIEGAAINFFASTDTGEVFIAESISDAGGKTILLIDSEMNLLIDSLGNISIKAKFEGNESFTKKEAVLEIRDLKLEVEFLEEDSLKNVRVKATNRFTHEMISGVEIKCFVKRLFNPLLIESVSTNESGIAEIEFPLDIPGDINGFLNIIIKIEDDDVYGNYETQKEIAWGLPIDTGQEKLERTLWSPNAPKWMLIVFIILMGTVWGHYIAIVRNFFRIKKARKSKSSDIHWDG